MIRVGIAALLLTTALRAPARITVCASGCGYSDLQKAINDAVSGDVLILRAGERFKQETPFLLDNDLGNGWVTIQSSALTSLPAGWRVKPEQAPLMAKVCSTSTLNQSVFSTRIGAHHWRLIGLEISWCAPGQTNDGDLVWLGNAVDEKRADQTSHHFLIDRCYIHGFPYDQGPQRALTVNVNDITISNNFIDEIHFTEGSNESHGIALAAGGSNLFVLNNAIGASTEGTFTGGGRDPVNQRFPRSIYFAGNYTFKRGSWLTLNFNHDPEGTTLPPVSETFQGQTWYDARDLSQMWIRSSTSWRKLHMPLGANEQRCFPGSLWRNQAKQTIWKCNDAGTRWISGASDVLNPYFARTVASVKTGNPTLLNVSAALESFGWVQGVVAYPLSAQFSGGTGDWAKLNGKKIRYTRTSFTQISIPFDSTGFGSGYNTLVATPQFIAWAQKNGAEFKTGVGIHYEGNVIENTWPQTFGNQRAFCFLLNWVPVQDGPNAALADLYFGNNICRGTLSAVSVGSIQNDIQVPGSNITTGPQTLISGLGSFFGRIGEAYYISQGTGDFADLEKTTRVFLTDTGTSQGGKLGPGQAKINYDSTGKSTAGVTLRFRDDSQDKPHSWPRDIIIDNNLFEIASPYTMNGFAGYTATSSDSGTRGYSATMGTGFMWQIPGRIRRNTVIRRHAGPDATFVANPMFETARLAIHTNSGKPADATVPVDIRLVDNIDDSGAGRFVSSASLGEACNVAVTKYWTPDNGRVTMAGNAASFPGFWQTEINVINNAGYGDPTCIKGWSRVWSRSGPAFPTTEKDGSVSVSGGVATFEWAAAARLLPNSRFCVTASTPANLKGCYVVPDGVTEASTAWKVAVPGVPNGTYKDVRLNSSMDFVDFANGDYRLATTSPFKGTGQNGADPGYDQNVTRWATETAISGALNPYLTTRISSIDSTATSATICYSAYDGRPASVTVAAARTYQPDLGKDVISQKGRAGCITVSGLTPATRYFARLHTAGRYRDTFRNGRIAEFVTRKQ